jgi:hypothetical protein
MKYHHRKLIALEYIDGWVNNLLQLLLEQMSYSFLFEMSTRWYHISH